MTAINSQHQFKEFVRILGRGRRAGRHLTQQEAQQAMTLLLRGEVTAEQKGAFLMLLRMREETPQELAGFVQACRQSVSGQWSSLEVNLDMGCYAGKRRHLPWFLLAVLVLAQSGKRIFLHGTAEPESQRLYLHQVFAQLGIPLAVNPLDAERQLATQSFCYVPLSRIAPQLDDLIQLRSTLGLRSCANTLARMLNPAQASHSYQGVFHRHLDQRHSDTAKLNDEANVLCLRGEGGETELNPERAVELHLCRGGQQSVVHVPALAQQWSCKPRCLDASQLIPVWQGAIAPEYAINAISGTLASILVLTEHLNWPDALATAQAMWQQRNKDWPYPRQMLHKVGA